MLLDPDPHGPAAAPPVSFDRDSAWVYFQGEMRRYRDCHLGPMTHALHYGTGCFEGIRAYWNDSQQQLYLFRVQEHYERLRQSTRILKIALPLGTDELTAVTTDLLGRNQFRSDVYIRPLAYKSTEDIGVRLHNLEDAFLIYAQPFGNYIEAAHGTRCMVSSWRRVDDNTAPARAKITGTYVNSALAKTEAYENGFDEAIVLGQDGHVCEGSAENLFMVRKGTLITPPVYDNILEGITRATVMQMWAEDLGLPVLERSIDRTELYVADEVLLCGTGAQLSPVVEIDHRPVGDGEIGPYSRQLQRLYSQLVRGQVEKYREWCLPVY
ncbi:MAG: branched-chain amino acid transaminase [Candidatus Dormibacteraeota bacterium]|nr:branched-chain amino acid transaminase [Candidatus Dormibacteraeota bacterium]